MVRNLAELGPNLRKIMMRLLSNQDLLKLLYYTDKDPLGHDDFTTEEINKYFFEELIKIVPRMPATEDARSRIGMRVAEGYGNPVNGEFTTISLKLEIFVPLTQWIIKSEQLRPFAIMGQIQRSLNNKKIDNFGKMVNEDFQLTLLTDEMSCYEMSFLINEYS